MRQTKAQILSGVNYTTAKKIGNNTYLYTRPDGAQCLRLHKTDIAVHLPDGRVQFFTGGWKTPTTKERLDNLPVPFPRVHIWQEKGAWTLHWQGKAYPFAEGITIGSDNSVIGAAPASAAKEGLKLAKAIRAYAKGYAEALLAGDVPAPGNGDCMGCHFRKQGTGENAFGLDHYTEHFREKYYVPSLLNNAMQHGDCLSPIVKGIIGGIWAGKPEQNIGWLKDVFIRQVSSCITKFLKHEFGLAR